jgi:hypothetical protein
MLVSTVRHTGPAARRRGLEALLFAGLVSPALLLAGAGGAAHAGQLTASDFQAYNPANAASIQPGPSPSTKCRSTASTRPRRTRA